jgi:hypothetical protein
MSITAGRGDGTFAADLGPIPQSRRHPAEKAVATHIHTIQYREGRTWALSVPSALHVDATETRSGDRILTFAALTARLYG